ncbi:MAG: hypothetical protein WBW16_12435 [Bacteroidota bacterium]|jgi:hypothetical protein
MTILKPEEQHERKESLPPFEIHLLSYRLDKTYYCTVDNVDPGAVIARAKGATREEAEAKAIAKAKERILQTRIFNDENQHPSALS